MLNVIAIAVVVSFAILLVAAYHQSKKTRQELISEMKEEILSNEPAPVEPPAPVAAKLKEVAIEVKNLVETLAEAVKVEEKAPVEAPKAEVKEMIASQEAPAPKPKNNRRRGRPGKKQQNNSTK
jgi:cell division protein FtsN